MWINKIIWVSIYQKLSDTTFYVKIQDMTWMYILQYLSVMAISASHWYCSDALRSEFSRCFLFDPLRQAETHQYIKKKFICQHSVLLIISNRFHNFLQQFQRKGKHQHLNIGISWIWIFWFRPEENSNAWINLSGVSLLETLISVLPETLWPYVGGDNMLTVDSSKHSTIYVPVCYNCLNKHWSSWLFTFTTWEQHLFLVVCKGPIIWFLRLSTVPQSTGWQTFLGWFWFHRGSSPGVVRAIDWASVVLAVSFSPQTTRDLDYTEHLDFFYTGFIWLWEEGVRAVVSQDWSHSFLCIQRR